MMRLLCLMALTILAPPASAQFFGQPTVTVDLRSYDPQACTGFPHDDNPAFLAFGNDYRRGGPKFAGEKTTVVLHIPGGATCSTPSEHGGNDHPPTPFYDIPIFVCSCTGVTMDGTVVMRIGAGFVWNPNFPFADYDAPTQSVQAGAQCVTLITPSDTSKFTVGNWAIMTGLNLQGASYPPNFGYWDYVLVSSIDAINGIVCFATTPLKNHYLSTWPAYDNFGVGGPLPNGVIGPAALLAMNRQWNVDVTFIGVTWQLQGGGVGTLASGRHVKLVNNTFTNASICPTPSILGTIEFDNVTLNPSCNMEVDKLIDYLEFNNTTTSSFILTQSPVKNWICNNTTFNNTIAGTGTNFIGNNCTMNARVAIGTNNYGQAYSFYCNTCFVKNQFTQFGKPGFDYIAHGPPIQAGVSSIYPYTAPMIINGVMTFGPDPFENVLPWAIPGCCYQFGTTNNGGGFQGFPFSILRIRQVTPGSYYSGAVVETDLFTRYGITGFPPLPSQAGIGSNYLVITGPAAPTFTCINCSGAPSFRQANNAPAGTPYGNYAQVTYDCHNMSNQSPRIEVGKFISATFNVTVADTTQSTFTVNGANIREFDQSDAAGFNVWTPVINMKIAGVRTVTPTTVTGAQSGDVIVAPHFGANTWLAGYDQFAIASGSDPGNDTPCPSITVTIQTDQEMKGGIP
jgi:hypothetical protein